MNAPTHETPTAHLGPTRSEQAEASSAHSRINIPLNLENWKHLAPEVAEQLLWFHQFVLDNKLGWEAAAQALDYDNTVIFKALKGNYQGNWKNLCDAIKAFRKREETPLTLKKHEFVENSVTRRVFGSLSYAMSNNCIVIIIGESGQGKSVATQAWKRENNHGKTVMVIAPAFGGTKALLREIAGAVGINKNLPAPQMHEAILRAFNSSRMLVIDEAHRLLPNDRRTNPVNLEILRDIHDRTNCGLALVATARFDTDLKKSEYMFEQLVGRSFITRLPRRNQLKDIEPIVRQFISRPTDPLLEACMKVAEQPGRLRILVEILKVARKVAEKQSAKPGPEHVFTAIKIREQMQGEILVG